MSYKSSKKHYFLDTSKDSDFALGYNITITAEPQTQRVFLGNLNVKNNIGLKTLICFNWSVVALRYCMKVHIKFYSNISTDKSDVNFYSFLMRIT